MAAFEQTLSSDQAAQFILRAPRGLVISLGGVDGGALRELVDQAEYDPDHGRGLFLRLRPAATIEGYIEQVMTVLAETAMRLWPVWFSDLSFEICRDDVVGRQAAGVIAREAAARYREINGSWTEAAARLTLAGRQPRPPGFPAPTELAQLTLAISRSGLVLITDVTASANAPNAPALTHALEWIAQNSRAAVVVLFPDLPPANSPFERLLYGARRVIGDAEREPTNLQSVLSESCRSETWLVPWRGVPHPLSDIEQRLAAMLRLDSELAPLFRFNWVIDTVRGSRPKVDLVWIDGRLVVELDGYADHGTRRAFIGDRHRDYELALSGYTVLRLSNDEVMQDFGRAIEKIRDLVRLRRSQMKKEI
jgi:very-short-patch-repair endonuclease